ncbi:hypothetical protein [uncultured Novosphingobium sp.]|uniref:hypothetical protein n=1 Tax=uncultured Novosphingobium sp. TaxID=292277 RepID=UPI002587769B|nr:hypothetical protein [uncultured Novosphingobium sp.]
MAAPPQDLAVPPPVPSTGTQAALSGNDAAASGKTLPDGKVPGHTKARSTEPASSDTPPPNTSTDAPPQALPAAAAVDPTLLAMAVIVPVQPQQRPGNPEQQPPEATAQTTPLQQQAATPTAPTAQIAAQVLAMLPGAAKALSANKPDSGDTTPADAKAPASIEAPALAEAAVPGQPLRTDPQAVSAPDARLPGVPAAPVTASAPQAATQDIAALVDRISEARAAAAPNTVRAALVHQDFGSVSLNIRADDSHLQVTLGNADPGFAPAVHAAAAASLAGQAFNDGTADDSRRDSQHQQQGSQPQPNTAQDPPTSNNTSSQQQQQAMRDKAASEREAPRQHFVNHLRGNAGEKTSPTSARERRSGIYA